MNPFLQLALFAAQQLLLHFPELYADFQKAIAKKNVTVAELEAERNRVANLTYEQLVPNTQLPPIP